MDKPINISGPEGNQELLNAIRKKFAAQGDNNGAAPFNGGAPTTFHIPVLKAPPSKNTCKTDYSSSPLNQFILGQLKNVSTNGFTLPKLQTKGGDNASTRKFDIPLLNRIAPPVTVISEGIQNLKVGEGSVTDKVPIQETDTVKIDLTKALNPISKTRGKCSATAAAKAARSTQKHFDIPFIDCDRRAKFRSNAQNCLLNAADIVYTTFPSPPSAVGRILSEAYEEVRGLKRKPDISMVHLKQCLDGRHGTTIKPFDFSTPSPDAIALQALPCKFQRLSHTPFDLSIS